MTTRSSSSSIRTSASTATPASRPAPSTPASPRTSSPRSGPSTQRSTPSTSRARSALVAPRPQRVHQRQARSAVGLAVDDAGTEELGVELQVVKARKERVVVLVQEVYP